MTFKKYIVYAKEKGIVANKWQSLVKCRFERALPFGKKNVLIISAKREEFRQSVLLIDGFSGGFV